MRNPSQTRRRLLEAASAQMALTGAGGVRVDTLAAKAGINKRMIYHYFGSKEGVCAGALELQLRYLESFAAQQRSEGLVGRIRPLRSLLKSQLPSADVVTDSEAAFVPDMAGSAELPGPDAFLPQAAIIVLRALLDLRSDPEQNAGSSDLQNMLNTTAWLWQLAWGAADSLGLESESRTQHDPAKRRVSLSPVITPL